MKRDIFAIVHCAQLLCASSRPVLGQPDTSAGDTASDGSFAVNDTGTGFAPWFGF